MVASLSPAPCLLSPEHQRCPDCGRPASLRRKGRRAVRCPACNLASLRERHRAYDAAHRAQRQQTRRQGGLPCPPYVAWTVEAWKGQADVLAVYQWPQWPVAVVLPAYGACSCGEAGCVHLVVACLAQQGEGGEGDA